MKYLTNLWQSNRSVHIGLVAKCEINDNYGLIFGFRKAPYGDSKQKATEHKIFYFEKDVNFKIERNTLVTYLSFDYNPYSPKAERVYPLAELISHHDSGGIIREDGRYHDDETWKLINEEKPFIDYYDRDCIIYYPTIEDDICYIWEGLWGVGMYWNIEGYIYKMWNEILKTNCKGWTSWPSLEETTEKISEIKHYIDSINANDIIDTYEILRKEWYQSRQGKDDDFFHIDIISNLQSSDKYFQYLLPLEKDEDYIEVPPGEGYKYKNGVYFLEEETKAAKDKARLEYSKEKHLAYLIRDFFCEANEQELYLTRLYKDIYYQFDVENANEVLDKFRGKIDNIRFRILLDKYNECKEDMVSKGNI